MYHNTVSPPCRVKAQTNVHEACSSRMFTGHTGVLFLRQRRRQLWSTVNVTEHSQNDGHLTAAGSWARRGFPAGFLGHRLWGNRKTVAFFCPFLENNASGRYERYFLTQARRKEWTREAVPVQPQRDEDGTPTGKLGLAGRSFPCRTLKKRTLLPCTVPFPKARRAILQIGGTEP